MVLHDFSRQDEVAVSLLMVIRTMGLSSQYNGAFSHRNTVQSNIIYKNNEEENEEEETKSSISDVNNENC